MKTRTQVSLAIAVLFAMKIAFYSSGPLQAETIGFVEEFALAKDRESVLKKLIPGTEDYYYFHALHFLNEQQWGRLEPIMETWVSRYGETNGFRLIRHREALLRYRENNQKSLDYLVRNLGLSFNHEQIKPNAKPNLPTALAPETISREAFLAEALRISEDLSQFTESGLDYLIRSNAELSEAQRRHLLSRLAYPDYERLPGLVAADLRTRESRGFGEFAIHRQLLPAQLDELERVRPELRNDFNFIGARISKMHPGADVDWTKDAAVRLQYLTGLWNYVKTLDPVHNSLKANVLFQILLHHRNLGAYPDDLWLEYLKLPRQVSYIEPRYLSQSEGQARVDLNRDFTSITRCPPIGSDEALVREYLLRELADAGTFEGFSPYIRDNYLKRLFAEAKLTSGNGDAEKWYSMLSPGEVQQLKDRVDIEFSPANPKVFLPADGVALDVYLKNVKDLVVKVYRVNELNYYLDQGRDINTDLNLDGLIANEEFKHAYATAPVIRQKQSFTFDSLKGKRGSWVIEFIGNGVSSRALVRKGQLQYLSNNTAAGALVTVLDESNQPVPDAAIWFGAKEYRPLKDGRILLPFSTAGRQSIILTGGGSANFDYIDLPSENYQLRAGFHVERESLIPGNEAQVAVRPALFSAGVISNVSLLEEAKLTIRSTDLDGIESVLDVPGFKLLDDKESVHAFRVPERLRRLDFTLEAKIPQVTKGGEKTTLSDSHSFSVNGIDESEMIADLHLGRTDGNYFVEVLGKTGEPVAERPVTFRFKHREFNNEIHATLKSDERGRVQLGLLAGISGFHAQGSGLPERDWSLRDDRVMNRPSVHASKGDTVQAAIPGNDAKPVREKVALFELRGETFAADRFDKVSLEAGLLKIAGLDPGDYLLLLRENGEKVHLRITDAKNSKDGYLLSSVRHLQARGLPPVQVRAIRQENNKIIVDLVNAKPSTRVHVYATRYLPEFPMAEDLDVISPSNLALITRGSFDSLYLSGRDIGEEYRYIIDRRGARKFPGNMAPRPGLLLNPWALQETDTVIHDARGGALYKRSAEAERSKRQAPGAAAKANGHGESAPRELSANLDFLLKGAPVAYNLVPGEDGTVQIERERLLDRQHIHVVAVDRDDLIYKQWSLPESAGEKFRDLTLKTPLDPGKHFTQRKKVTLLRKDNTLAIPDLRSSQVERYDTLAGAYGVLSGLADEENGKKLAEFSFILNWPTLAPEKKRELYSKHACHELSFFLQRRDEAFFKEVILPYLINKRDKTFLDHYLLGNDLRPYLEPWKFERLNVVEQLLLARRLGGDTEKNIFRTVKERQELLPVDLEEEQRLYRSAIRARGLSGEGREMQEALRLEDAKKEVAAMADAFAAPPAPAAAAPASAPMAFRSGAVAGAAVVAEAEAEMAEKSMESLKEEMPKRDGLGLELSDKDLGDLRRKAGTEPLYRKLDATREWAENNYYQLLIAQQIGSLVTVNAFWKDYAAWDGNGGFYSRHFPAAHRNFTEMMFALSLLDLPFSAEKHDLTLENGKMTITAKSPLVVFHEEIEESQPAAERPNILISQNFFRPDDRFDRVEGEQVDKFVTREFLTGTLYGCQVVLTNPASSSQKLDVLLQLPEGSLPANRAEYTGAFPIRLEPFGTEKLEIYFYFPKTSAPAGFRHFPVHVAKNESPVAWTAPFTFRVVNELTERDTGSWDYLSQSGSNEEVLQYIATHNVHSFDLGLIAWRMRDAAFFQQATAALRNRQAYHDTLWSYALRHNQVAAAREYLTSQEGFLSQCGGRLDCELVAIDPVDRHWYQHLEYSPLVNARAHQLGRDRTILNDSFHRQYHAFLGQLSFAPKLNEDDKLGVAAYLLLQDRVEEGLEWLGQVDQAKVATALQYDYLNACAALYREEPALAAQIATRYAKHPVDRWRERFAVIADQVKEITGAAVPLTDAEDRDQQHDTQAARLPSFDLKTEGSRVTITYQNVKEVTVNYYEMDLEFLFSSQPFVSAGSGQFSYIQPNFSEKKTLPADGDTFGFTVPDRFKGKNVLVEAVGEGQKRSGAVYANDLKLQVAENYGRIHVREGAANKPLSKTYVKVYARYRDGSVKFFKDGYTDLRGKFDYSSLNTAGIEQVERFSVLVMSEKNGALVREMAPPRM